MAQTPSYVVEINGTPGKFTHAIFLESRVEETLFSKV